MALTEALERLKAEKSYAGYALMHNPNDERYKSLVEAIDTVSDWMDKLVSCVSCFSGFELKGDAPQNFPDPEELPFG